MDYNGPLSYNTDNLGQTPAQVKATMDYAKALMTGSGQQPVKHWTQGLSNVVNALVGGDLDYRAALAEKHGIQDFASKQKTDIPAQNYPVAPVGTAAPPPFPAPLPGQTSFSEGTAFDSPKTADASLPRGIRNNNPLNIEAGDFTKSQPGFTGSDGRFAKFEKPEQGVAAANALLDSYEKRGLNTVAGIVGRWAPASDGNNVSAYAANVAKQLGVDPDQPLPPEMRSKLIAAMGQHENGRPIQVAGAVAPSAAPIAFAGPDNVSNIPAVQAMSSALRGGPSDAGGPGVQVAGGKAVPPASINLQRPDPQAGTTLINPALIKPQPGYTPSQLQAVMEHPFASPEQREAAHQMMLRRGQTIEMRSPTGVGTVMVDPNDPRVQQYIAPEPHWGTKKVSSEGIEQPTATTFDAQGRPIVVAPPSAVNGSFHPVNGPRSEAAPVAPAGAVLPSNGTPGTPAAENAPVSPTGAPEMPVKVVSTDPAAGVAATVGRPTVPAVPSPVSPLAQAMRTAPPGISQEDFDTIQGMRKAKNDAEAAQHQIINNMDVDKDAQQKTAEFAIKKYDTLSTQAAAARKQMPNLDYASALMNDPKFYSGFAANEVTAIKKVMAAFPGMFGADAATGAAPNEVFNKVISGSILDNMKTALGGLGQVRLAEIDLLKQANASSQNTPASNRALLELAKRSVNSVDHLDDLGQQYFSGAEVTDPVDGKVLLPANLDKSGEIAPRRGLDVGFDKLARKFTLEHPTLTKDEIARYQTIFKTGIDPNAPTTPTPAASGGAPAKGTIQDFSDGKGGTVKGQWDGTKWGPIK